MSYRFLLDLALILLSTKVLGLLTQRFQDHSAQEGSAA